VHQIAAYGHNYDLIVLIKVNAIDVAITRNNTFVSEFFLPVEVFFNLFNHKVERYLFGWFDGGPCSIFG
jgi:hypothetical protein